MRISPFAPRGQHGPDRRTLEPALFTALPSFRVHLLARLSERAAEVEYERLFGLTLAEIRVLAVAGTHGPVALKDLCAVAEIDKSYASRIVSRLAERGLMQRQADAQDQRSARLQLTPQGQALYGQIYAAATQRNQALLARLSPEDCAALLRAVEILIDRLRHFAADAPDASAPEPAPAMPNPPVPDREILEQAYALLGAALGRAE